MNRGIALPDGSMSGDNDLEQLQQENNRLKTALLQIDTARRDLNVLSMVLVNRLLQETEQEEVTVSRTDLEAVAAQSLGLQVRVEEDSTDLHFRIVNLDEVEETEENTVEDEQTQQESTEDSGQEVSSES